MKNTGAERRAVRRETVLIAVGLAFFCNPLIGMVDFLPDAIGAMLVFIGMTRVAFVDDSLEQARSLALRIAVFEAVKLIIALPVSSDGISMNSLTAVTVSVVCEAILFILFFNKFFAGIENVYMIYSLETANAKAVKAKFSAAFFLIARFTANVLPELFALAEAAAADPSSDEDLDLLRDLLTVRPVVTAALFVFALVAGVICAVRLISAVRAFCREASPVTLEKYAVSYGEMPVKRKLKRLRSALLIVGISSAFSLDLSIDGVRLLSFPAMFALIFIATFVMPFDGLFKRTRVFAAIAFFVSFGADIYRAGHIVPDPVVFYETTISQAVGAALTVGLSAVIMLLAVRELIVSVAEAGDTMRCRYSYGATWFFWVTLMLIHTATSVLPYLSHYLLAVKYVCAIAFFASASYCGSTFCDRCRDRSELYPDEVQ